MKKNFKNLFVSLALCASLCCGIVGVAVSGIFNAKQSVAEAYETLDGFTIEETASIRRNMPSGIRFTTNIESVSATVAALNDVEFGTLVLPADLLGSEELTHATEKVVDIPTTKWQNEEKTEYTSVLGGAGGANLSSSYYNRPIAARSYITGTDSNGTKITYYTENMAVRSLGYVAYMANLDGDTSELITKIVDETKVEITFNPEGQISYYNNDNTGTAVVTNALPKETSSMASIKIGGVTVPVSELEKRNATLSYESENSAIISVDGETLTAKSAGETKITVRGTFNGKELKAVTQNVSTDGYAPVSSQYKILISAKTAAHNMGYRDGETSYLPPQTEAASEAYFTYASEHTAAYLLQSIIEEATGVRLEVVAEGSAKYNAADKFISVGKTQLAKAKANELGLTMGSFKDANLASEYTVSALTYVEDGETKTFEKDTASKVQTVGDNVFLLGVTGQGTLYGAQRFLREMAGYGYYMEDSYVVDEKVDFVLPSKTLVYIPDIEYNVTQGEANSMHVNYGLQSYTQNIIPVGTTDEQDASGNYYKGINHNSTLVVDDKTHIALSQIDQGLNGGYNYYTENIKAKANHWMAWYATKSGSLSVGTYTEWVLWAIPAKPYTGDATNFILAELCYTAHGDIFSDYTRAGLVERVADEMYAKMQKFPTLDRLGFSQMDHNYWCQCSACKNEGNPSDNLLHFLLDVAANLKGKLEDAGDARKDTFKISTLFYHATSPAPKSTANYATELTNYMKHIEPWFAETKVDHVDPFNYDKPGTTSGWNEKVYEEFKKWANIANQYGADMLLWEYYVNTTNFFQPYDTVDAIRVNYGLFADAGIDYIFNQMMEGKNTWKRLKQFLISQLAWNARPTNDVWNGWIDEYFVGAYGDAAEEMRDYYDSMKVWSDAHKDLFRADNNYSTNTTGGTAATNASLTYDAVSSENFPKATLETWINLCNDALEALDPADPNYNTYYSNIMLEKLSPMYLIMYIYDAAPVVTETKTVTYKDKNQATQSFTYDVYGFESGADTSEVQTYGAEFAQWARYWNIRNSGEGDSKRIHLFYSYVDYTENKENGKWINDEQSGFIPAIEALVGKNDTIQVKHVNEIVSVEKASGVVSVAALANGTYNVSGAIEANNVTVNNGSVTLNMSNLTAGNTYALTFTNTTTGAVISYPNVVVVTGALSATAGVPAGDGYYFVTRDYVVEEGTTETWLSHNVFAKGSYTVSINGGLPIATTIHAAGKLNVQFNAPAVMGEKYLVEVSNGTQTYAFAVYGAKYIRTAEELKALGVGGNRNNTENIYGYYALGNDITFEHDAEYSDLVAAGYPANSTYAFYGTFDGNGYSINNMRVSDGGIFGIMSGTVKNVTLKDVHICGIIPHKTENKVVIKQYTNQQGAYTAIFAHKAPGGTFENINISIASSPNTYTWQRDGLFVVSGSDNSAATFRNITVSAEGVKLKTLLGISHNENNVYQNVLIKSAGYVGIGYTGDSYTSTGENVAVRMNEFPAGVRYIEVTERFGITNTEETVGIGEELTITTDKANLSYTYSLAKAVNGVSVDENGVVTVADNAKVGATFTVVVSGSNYQTEEITFTVRKAKKTLSAVVEIEQINGSFTIPSVEGEILKVTVGDKEFSDISGNTIEFGEKDFVKQETLGKGKTYTIETLTTIYTGTANIYTMIIDNKAELDQWQAVASDNAVAAGDVLEIQKKALYNGYFILGADIEYNATWGGYGIAWGAFNNKALWKEEHQSKYSTTHATVLAAFNAGWFIEGAIYEDWGTGVLGGFKGVFDGDGHYIDGMGMSGNFAGFVVTLGGGTIKNVAFTNAKVLSSNSGFVTNRGPGIIENVYVQVVEMVNGSDANNPTSIISRGPGKTISNIIVDVSAIDFANLEYAYVVSLATGTSDGVYVLGAGDAVYNRTPNGNTPNNFNATDKKASVFYELNGNSGSATDYDLVGSFATSADLLADATHGAKVRAWNDNGFWVVDTTYGIVIPEVLYEDALEDYKTIVLNETITIEKVSGTFNLPNEVEGTVTKVVVGNEEFTDINGKTVTIGENALVAQESLGKNVLVTIEADGKNYACYANVYTMIIDNKAELKSWQAVAADNSVKAGLCVEEQKQAVLSGYFVLGANIEYNDTWTPILPFAGVTPSIYTVLSEATANNLKTQYANDEVALSKIIQEGWGTGEKAGFKGVFDGDGHYINGLWVGEGYSGFVITLGGGTIKNVAFTNATVGSTSSVVANRGPGLIENVYVSVVEMANGSDKDNPTSVVTRGQYKTLRNIVVDVSAIDFANLEYAIAVNLVQGISENVYVLGAGDAIYNRTPNGSTPNNFSATDKKASVFYELNANSGSATDYDLVGSFATAADLLADATHGAIVKAWAGDFWTIDQVNGKVIPTEVLENNPVALKKPAILPMPTGQANVSVYEGNVASLGFPAGTYVSEVAISDLWNSRAKVTTDDVNADYISIDFMLAQGSTIKSFTIWPGTTGSIAINANGVSFNENALERTIVILDSEGNNATKGPWNAGEIYTLKYYFIGEEASKKYFAISSDNVNNVIYFANGKSGSVTELDETIEIIATDASFELPAGIVGEVTGVTLDGVNIFKGMNGSSVLLDAEALAANVASHGVGKALSIVTTSGEYNAQADVITKVIKTADDLKALGVGGNRSGVEQVYGYYVLGNNITFNHADDYSDLVTAGYPKNNDHAFRGTFDGRGYTLDNMRVSDGGIFGIMRGTVKNVNLTNVHMIDNPPAGVSIQNGGYIAILAYAAPNGTFENINISIASSPSTYSWKRYGLLVNSGSSGAATFRNITVSAEGMKLKSLLGISHNANNVYENVVIKAADYVAIGYTGDPYTTSGENVALRMNEFPAGVTFVKVAYVKDASGAIIPFYEGDVTDLGFEAGTKVQYVVQDNRTNMWNPGTELGLSMEKQGVMITKGADEDYASVLFAVSREFTGTYAFFTWWFDGLTAADNQDGGGYIRTDGEYYASGTTLPGAKAVAYDMNGNKVTSFAANTVYELRWYGEGAMMFKVACCEQNGQSITTYFAKPSSGSIETIELDDPVTIEVENGSFAIPSGVAGAVNSVTIDGVEIFASVSNGEIIFDKGAMSTGAGKELIIKTHIAEYVVSADVVTKIIKTAAELQALGVGGRTADGNGNTDEAGHDVYGYYVLDGNIDGSGLYFAAGISGQQSWFQGTFDGRGYTVANVIVSEGGIFGGMKNATVKNVNFTNVKYHDNTNGAGQGYNDNKQWGQYFGLLGQWANNINVENITVQISELNNYMAVGLLVYSGFTGTTNNFKNIHVDASGLTFFNVLELNYGTATMNYENVTIKAAGYSTIALKGGSKGSEAITEWPAGVTYIQSTHSEYAYYFKSGANANGEVVPFYMGDVTTLGFEAGTKVQYVVQDNRTGLWSAGTELGLTMEKQGIRITKEANEDYASIYFSLSREFTGANAFATWWFDEEGTNRSLAGYLKTDGTYTTASTGPTNFKVVAYDMEGNQVTSFAKNTVYEMRWYGEGAITFKVGCCEINGQSITTYFANAMHGNDA